MINLNNYILESCKEIKNSKLLKESILDTDELVSSNINIFEIIGKSKNVKEFINNIDNCLKICEDYKHNKKYDDDDYIIRYDLSGLKRDIPYLAFGKVSDKYMYTMRFSNNYLIMDGYMKSIFDIDLKSPLSTHKVYSPKKDISKEIEKLHKSLK